MKLLDHFGKCAGLNLNKEKGETLPLGAYQTDSQTLLGLKIVNKPLKILIGVWVGKKCEEILQLNYEEKIHKLNTIFNMWKQRQLTLKGNVTIINSLALFQLQYVASVVYVPENVIETVNETIYSFLWPKKAHVKKMTVIQEIEQGGLRCQISDVRQKQLKSCGSKCFLKMLSVLYWLKK